MSDRITRADLGWMRRVSARSTRRTKREEKLLRLGYIREIAGWWHLTSKGETAVHFMDGDSVADLAFTLGESTEQIEAWIRELAG